MHFVQTVLLGVTTRLTIYLSLPTGRSNGRRSGCIRS
jgi:hypothetical protein